MNPSPYETLGLSSSATQEEIKNVYRKLAKKFHPDLNPGNKSAEKRFKEINAAYELVGTPESRAKFDRGDFEEQRQSRQRGPFYRETQEDGGRYSYTYAGGEDEDDILKSIFGRMGGPMGGRTGGFRHSADLPGEDALYRMDIDFKDAILGAEREITLPSGKRLRVRIPPGVDTGAKLRFAGLGSPGAGKGRPGDAYVELKIRPSPLFKRTGSDLELELPISIGEALLGAEIRVPTVDGSVLLKLPAGVTSGSRVRVAGKGVPSAKGKRGDLYTVLKIMAPSGADASFMEAVAAWEKRQPFDPRAKWIGLQGDSAA